MESRLVSARFFILILLLPAVLRFKRLRIVWGQSDAFEAVKKKHPAIAADTSLSYPAEGLKELMLQRFNAMVDQDFELLQFLAREGVDADALRKKLEELSLE